MYLLQLLVLVININVFGVQGKESDLTPPLIGTKTVKQSQFSILDNTTTYSWMSYDDWQCNLPSRFPNNTRIRASYYSGKNCCERILVLSQSHFISRKRNVETWTYRLETESWEIIRSRNQETPPEIRVGSILVTVCQTKVLYITTSSSVWIFDGQTELWSSKTLTGIAAPTLTDSESALFFALLDKRSNHPSLCECNYAVVGISTVKRLWILRCDHSSQKFMWTRVTAGGSMARDDEYPSYVIDSTGVAATMKGFVLVMAKNGLWNYSISSNHWSQVSSYAPVGNSFLFLTAAFYSPKKKLYTLCLDDRVLQYSFSRRGSWISYKLGGDTPNYRLAYHYVTMTTDTFRFLLYGGGLQDCEQLMWELYDISATSKLFTNIELGTWALEESPMPKLSPSTFEASVGSVDCIEDALFVLVGTERNKLQLWQLHLNTMTWTLLINLDRKLLGYFYMGHVPVSTSVQTAVFYGNIYHVFYAQPDCNYMWIARYNTKEYPMGLGCNPHVVRDLKVEGPAARIGNCISSLNSSTVILYGGRSIERYNFRYLHDIWLATLPSPELTDLKWTEVEPVFIENSTLPLPRTSYQCVVVEDTLLVMGGVVDEDLYFKWVGEETVESVSCYRDVWRFSLLSSTWSHVFVDDSNDRSMCIVSAVSVGGQVVVTFRSSENIPASEHRKFQLCFYVVNTMTWIFHSEMVSSDTFYTFFWKGRIFFFQHDLKGLFYRDLFCPAGSTSPDISKGVCEPCLEGSYAEGLGDKYCTQCPRGLTTKSTGSTSSRNCSYCKKDYCMYGDCTVVLLANGDTQPRCQCKLGFSGVKCQNPRDILISLAVSVSVAVTVSGLVAVVRTWRKKKLRERSLIHHVEELANVWQIKEKEITQMEVIGSGGYGVVYRVRYRDMFAAMKILRQPTDDAFLWEFEREIKFMQTVRHPNIVLFLGAGRTRDGSPFIISEFVSRGSLRDLLDDETREISYVLKVKFALDISRGMNFLHSLNPPRVHRDLKSDNLLISETDIVKITDFGLGKQIATPHSSTQQRLSRRRRFWGERSNSQSVPVGIGFPLLQTRGRDSPHALGAVRWRAPELSVSRSSKRYTKAADVYR